MILFHVKHFEKKLSAVSYQLSENQEPNSIPCSFKMFYVKHGNQVSLPLTIEQKEKF